MTQTEVDALCKARVIVRDRDLILFIHRIKNGREYYVLPGGTIEPGECPKDAAVREVEEETSLSVTVDDIPIEKHTSVNGCTLHLYIFNASSVTGRLALGGPELKRQNDMNQYIHEWIPIDTISDLIIYPEEVKDILIANMSECEKHQKT